MSWSVIWRRDATPPVASFTQWGPAASQRNIDDVHQLGHVQSPDQLREEADAAECLARLVSYGPDKQRLLETAQRLRNEAKVAQEKRSWGPDKKLSQ
jgi:hypothetical protein